MATGSMSAAGQKQYWEDADSRYSTLDCNRCEQQRDHLLRYSPIIRYMSDNIRRLGGDLNSSNIRCRTCKTGMLGGFDHRYGIMLCANWVDKRKTLEDVLAHEMVHAYDHLRFQTNLDHESSLREVACSEVCASLEGPDARVKRYVADDEELQQIRASNLSGECRWTNEFFGNKILAFTNHHQDCVRRRAIHSVRNRPNCPDEATAAKTVDEVWQSCFRDTRPFDEIYR
jgi:mitochondrial inner membrane protease ATP23